MLPCLAEVALTLVRSVDICEQELVADYHIAFGLAEPTCATDLSCLCVSCYLFFGDVLSTLARAVLCDSIVSVWLYH